MKKNKLIKLRKEKKVSQTDIATYLKISQTQYQKRESGKITMTEQEWNKIAILLDVTVDDIHENNNYQLDKKSLKEELEFLKEKIKILEQKLASA
ncbi:helix-turn-helix transcriptional regulator [Chryseobacterium sp. S-02]|uniref:helix-turn-helix transcriptional regulator n=1 Tax=Chryseobacterium sp. S-02 TaxID=3404064 RepID=UPI003CFA0E14